MGKFMGSTKKPQDQNISSSTEEDIIQQVLPQHNTPLTQIPHPKNPTQDPTAEDPTQISHQPRNQNESTKDPTAEDPTQISHQTTIQVDSSTQKPTGEDPIQIPPQTTNQDGSKNPAAQFPSQVPYQAFTHAESRTGVRVSKISDVPVVVVQDRPPVPCKKKLKSALVYGVIGFGIMMFYALFYHLGKLHGWKPAH